MRSRPLSNFLPAVLALALAFLPVAIHYAGRFGLSSQVAISIYAAFVLQMSVALAPAFWSHETRPRVSDCALGAMLLLWLAPYFLYAAATGDFRTLALGKLIVLAMLPLAVYRIFPVSELTSFCWQDVAVAIWLIASVLSWQLKGIWNVPVNLDFMSRLFLIGVASWCWTFLRPVPRLGYRFQLSWPVLQQASLNFVYFAAIGVPLSLALHFTRWHPQWRGVIPFCLDYLQIFLFVALLEELFFRGFLQSLLAGRLGNYAVSQAMAACLFGLFHILHAPSPNWRYVLLATIAGWFYGSAFRRSGLVAASALTHAAVDTVWRTFFAAR